MCTRLQHVWCWRLQLQCGCCCVFSCNSLLQSSRLRQQHSKILKSIIIYRVFLLQNAHRPSFYFNILLFRIIIRKYINNFGTLQQTSSIRLVYSQLSLLFTFEANNHERELQHIIIIMRAYAIHILIRVTCNRYKNPVRTKSARQNVQMVCLTC